LPVPDVVRQPDVAVVEEARLKDAKADDYLAGAPLVAIEVASPGNTAEELDLKIDQYLRGGSQAVWVAYPKRKAIGTRWSPAGFTRPDIGLAKRFQRTSSRLPVNSILRSSF
jgi:Uma2 family endonuclease